MTSLHKSKTEANLFRRVEISKHCHGELIGTINVAEFRENTRTLLTLDTHQQYFLLLLSPAYSLLQRIETQSSYSSSPSE